MTFWRSDSAARDALAQVTAISKSQAVIEFNMDGTIITANSNFLNALGYRLDEIQGKPHSMFVLPAMRESAEYRAFWANLTRGEFQAAEYPRILQGFADGEPIDPLLDDRHRPQAPGPLQLERPMIEAFFSQPSIHDIIRALEQATGASEEWAQKTLADLRKVSPISLAITDRHIRAARTLDLRETLIQDYRLAVGCLNGRDFYEGVRAALVDKDGKPVWSEASIEDISEASIAAYFEPLGAGELILPTRREMQASRV